MVTRLSYKASEQRAIEIQAAREQARIDREKDWDAVCACLFLPSQLCNSHLCVPLLLRAIPLTCNTRQIVFVLMR